MQANYAEVIEEQLQPQDWPEKIDAASQERLVLQYYSPDQVHCHADGVAVAAPYLPG